MTTSDEAMRVVIAVTESSSLQALWRAALDTAKESEAKIVAVYLHDERWQQAASLPFTREISRIGSVADFTAQRAEQLLSETVSRLKEQMQKLAIEADLEIEFEVLPESDRMRAQALIGEGKNVLIAPSYLADRPIYTELAQLDLHILLVEE